MIEGEYTERSHSGQSRVARDQQGGTQAGRCASTRALEERAGKGRAVRLPTGRRAGSKASASRAAHSRAGSSRAARAGGRCPAVLRAAGRAAGRRPAGLCAAGRAASGRRAGAKGGARAGRGGAQAAKGGAAGCKRVARGLQRAVRWLVGRRAGKAGRAAAGRRAGCKSVTVLDGDARAMLELSLPTAAPRATSTTDKPRSLLSPPVAAAPQSAGRCTSSGSRALISSRRSSESGTFKSSGSSSNSSSSSGNSDPSSPMSPYEIGLISRLSISARDTSARPPHATAQLPDGHIPRQPPNASQSAELRAAPSASTTEAVVVCRTGEPFTVVAQASFRAPFRVEMRVAGQSLGYTEYFYSPGEINLHWFQGWHLGQGRFAPFTCDPALPRDADAELGARVNCSAGTAQLKPAQVSLRKSRGLWLQSRAPGVKESTASLGSRRKAAGGTRGLPTDGRCGIAGAHGGDAGKRSGRRHAVASAWWCCSGAHSPALRMTALTTGARGGIERRGKLHWRGGQRAPQPQQQQQWRGNEKQGNEKQGNGEQAAGEVVPAEQEWGELDGCGWRDEWAGLPIPSALALSFDPCSNAPDTSSNDGTESLSSPPSSPPSSPFHPRHTFTGAAERAEADRELGAVCGECSAGEQQVGAACRLQCLPASFSHPCALSPLTQPALHLHALHDAAASHGSTDDEDGDKSSNAPHEDAASSSDSGRREDDAQEDDPDGVAVPYRSCLPPLLSLWPRRQGPPQQSNLPPVLPSDVPAAPPPAGPVVVDFRVDVLFQSIRLLPCTACPPHVTAAGPPHTTAQCEYCEKRLRWYLGEGGSGQAAPAAVEGVGGARGEEMGGAGGVGAAGGGGGGGGGMSALDVPGPVPFHYEDLDEQAYRFYCADIARWLPEGGARGGGAVAGKKQRRVAEAVASAEGAIRGEGRRRREVRAEAGGGRKGGR
ncbi:unnamed protein product [Closterium sp. NIES-53]